MIRTVAATQANVLLLGESGTGKEVVGRVIHYLSSQRDGPYVPVDCAALPPNLIESLLFGHEEGSFTDALKTQSGKFEQANGGTLFLDEVGNIPLSIQAKLLRFIEKREVERVGGKKPIPVSVRLIAATNADLKEGVRKGSFRQDLFHRLNEFPITLPPLRERREDIPNLCQRLLKLAAAEMDMDTHGFSNEALRQLVDYDYPGNIRELKNILSRLVVMAGGGEILPEHLPVEIKESNSEKALRDFHLFLPKNAPLKEVSRRALKEVETYWIREALRKTHGHYGKAADLLGITPRTLYNKMKEFNLEIPEYPLLGSF